MLENIRPAIHLKSSARWPHAHLLRCGAAPPAAQSRRSRHFRPPRGPVGPWQDACSYRGADCPASIMRKSDMTQSKSRQPVVPGSTGSYAVLPLRDIVVFPHMIVPLFVGREKSIRALEEAVRSRPAHPAGDADQRQRRRSGDRRDLQDRHAGQRPPAPEAARRHREGAGRGRRPRQDRPLHQVATTYYEAEAETLADELGDQRRGRGAGALGDLRVRELREAQQEDLARGRLRGHADRRALEARRHRRLAPRGQDRRQAGDPGDPDGGRSASSACCR